LELRIEAKEEDFTRDRPQRAPEREAAESEFFETKVPTLPPSSRIIAQGSQIRAVLLSRIDTRNPGNVIAQVTADHYDSIRAETLLIPKGSRLIGAYANSVSPGNTQLAIAFSRLMLPDGRAIDLGGMPATGNDGIVGIQGDYNGNFWRAVGPAILTTLVGSAIDEATRPEEGEGTASTGFGGTVQSPTVAQQSIPKITDAVLERYRGAQPYITAEPGQALKILVTADLEIPVLETSRR
jgi:type IV secretion system protein VirB10